MDMQKIFNIVVAHARAQREQAIDEGADICMYRAPNGNKCFIGALINDEQYRPTLENLPADSGAVLRAVAESQGIYSIDDHEVKFLKDLQMIHDRHSIDEWEKTNFPWIAQRYNLEMPASE